MNAETEYAELLARLMAEGMTKPEAIYHIATEHTDLNAARNEAYTQRHFAMRAQAEDPIKRERAEAERLVALVRARYSTPGLQAHFTGDTKPTGNARYVFGVGWFEAPEWAIPWEVQVVCDLATCIGRIDGAESVASAVAASKLLIALLREAQVACGETPEPLALSKLTTSQKSIALVMYRAGSLSVLDSMQRIQIREKLDLHADTIKDALVGLRELRLVDTAGKRAGLRYYLSPEGATLGRYLDAEG